MYALDEAMGVGKVTNGETAREKSGLEREVWKKSGQRRTWKKNNVLEAKG